MLEGVFAPETKGTAKYLGIMLHMQEEAGNEYQGATDVEFDIKLNAYQLAAEEDGFNNPNYDANAYFDGKPADSFKDDLYHLLTDENYYKDMQSKGRKVIENEYSWDASASIYIQNFK